MHARGERTGSWVPGFSSDVVLGPSRTDPEVLQIQSIGRDKMKKRPMTCVKDFRISCDSNARIHSRHSAFELTWGLWGGTNMNSGLSVKH